MSGTGHIAFEVCQSLPNCRFDGLATPLYFAHKHRALYCGNTKISHTLLVGLPRESSLGFLSKEECSQLALHDFKDEADVLPD